MKKIIFFLVFINFFSCVSKEAQEKKEDSKISNVEFKDYYEYTLPIDNENVKKVGFYKSDDFPEEGTGIKAIGANSKSVFLLDGFHQNIKKLNIESGSISNSEIITNDNLIDMILFNKKLYITGMFGGVYVYDNELNYITTLKLDDYSNSEKYLYIKDGKLFIYIPHKSLFIEVKNENALGNVIENSNVSIFGVNTARSETFNYLEKDLLLKTKYGELKLTAPYENTFEYYNSINIYYNPKILTFFTIDKQKESVKLFIYKTDY